jgi:hypothetical protein
MELEASECNCCIYFYNRWCILKIPNVSEITFENCAFFQLVEREE